MRHVLLTALLLCSPAAFGQVPPLPLPRPAASEPKVETPATAEAPEAPALDAGAVLPDGEVAPLPRPRPPAADTNEADDAPAPPAVAAPTDATPAEAAPSSRPEVVVDGANAVESAPADEGQSTAPPARDETRVYQTACPAVMLGLVEAERLPPIAESDCHEQSPLSVTGILANGRMVPLSTPIITNCEMASALPRWAEAIDGYVKGRENTALASITTGTSYMCRQRNSSSSQFLSEHGFANAIDVVGFKLEDGRNVVVEQNWLPPEAPEGRLLRYAHDAACTGFMTVLGPEANAEHHDHLHLDLGCHGKSCTAKICE